MIIEKMFKKPIDRDIQGVIKANDTKHIYQELDEYVVTDELLKHFREFFSNYEKSIDGNTSEMGVWISGHFGSGKSHFLKILSYILNNEEIKGRHAIDFFKDDEKIVDPIIIANMEKATSVSTDAILFNIDSKAATGGSEKSSIIDVFLKVFNEMCGYSGEQAFLAEFERNLDKNQEYEKFKEEFKKIHKHHEDWENVRDEFLFIHDEIVKTLINTGWSEEAAKEWIKNGEKNYKISIEKFADLVNDYCKNKGSNHHIVFLVDEIGQYIGDNSDLMLNLQTVTEELGVKCNGKAWVVVTAQEAIGSMLEIKGHDFSKIQGRFKTKLSLSSANVDEVIRKRILEKTEDADESLQALYDDKYSMLKNVLNFTQDTPENIKKLYSDSKNFANIYPFIPYQFDLVQNVLESIRKFGASGKSLSQGERSMIALFQESAIALMKEDSGILVPFNKFYEPIHKFVDSNHRRVITKAKDNAKLKNFDVEVLKILFLIKYLKEINANLENITTLMVDNVDVVRKELNDEIKDSLKRLEEQTLISKNGEIYSFLTNDEQNIRNAIKEENVEEGEIINHISDSIFEEIYEDSKFKYDNNHDFEFNKAVDSVYKGNRQSADIGLRFITSLYDFPDSNNGSQQKFGNENNSLILKGMSESDNEVIISLNDDQDFIKEIRDMLKTNRFIIKHKSSADSNSKSIYDTLRLECDNKKSRIEFKIEESIKNADIYVNGIKTNFVEKNAEDRINDALNTLVKKVYYKLSSIKSNPKELEIINKLKQQSFEFGQDPDSVAVDDLIHFIDLKIKTFEKPSLKIILNRYKKAPYGFTKYEILYLIATLFSSKRIYLIKNSEQITLKNNSPEDILKYLTTKNNQETILIDKKETIDIKKINLVKDILKEFFGESSTFNDQEDLKDKFMENISKYDEKLDKIFNEYTLESRFPGKEIINDSKELLKKVKSINSTKEFFEFVNENEDEFFDLHDNLEAVMNFFDDNQNSQKKIFIKALKTMDLYEKNELNLNNDKIKELYGELNKITIMKKPYSNIKNLPEIYNQFNKIYDNILESKKEEIENNIEYYRINTLNKLNDDSLKNEFDEKVNNKFDSFNKNLKSKNDIHGLSDFKDFAKDAYTDFNKEIENFIKTFNDKTGGDIPSTPKSIELNIKDIIDKPSLSIQNEEEIDNFVEKIKQKLKKEFEDLKDEKGSLNLRFYDI
ncbi:MAG: BREX system P-loop protein BrxC [Methanobrevibacter sp.]|jgi:hypothetical protein|nr:BREX system P-loop protein BrxC [Candidatus Methanoflexus mossambicus]